ncbi:hypothetical protein [Nonomuraea endophytica]|uniref:hypothetical protein n=1 Tax=Nonomuraea endophytica TaxID=714136 RepID=UPI0037C8577E
MITLVAAGLAVPVRAAEAAAPGRPPALPESGSGPAAFAYLCANPKDPDKSPTGACDTWRLVTTNGQILSVPEAVAWEKSRDSYEDGIRSFAISPDGTRVAYHRARDNRVVVRELISGKIWTIPYQVPTGSLASPLTLKFVRDGGQLTIFAGDTEVTTLVEVEAGTARRMPKGWVVLDADPDTGRITLQERSGMNVGPFRTVGGGRTVTAKIPIYARKHFIWGSFAARDGRAANLVPKEPPACGPDMTPVWLAVFSTRTGKMTTVKPRLPADVYRADVIDWLSPQEIVAAAGRERPGKTPDTTIGSYVYAMNVTTGASRLIAKLSTTEEVYRNSLAVGGYTTAPDRPAAGKLTKPGKRGCE